MGRGGGLGGVCGGGVSGYQWPRAHLKALTKIAHDVQSECTDKRYTLLEIGHP